MPRIRRVLIANRGEIAVRINRACRSMGVETVQVFTEADRDSLAVKLADKAVCIGQARSTESYLNPAFIVSAAMINKADAIHPGYGFLSENAGFARMCTDAKITFIGPTAEAIGAMGDKATARRLAIEAEVPVTPGSRSTLRNANEALHAAEEVGYPVVLKATAGGGGRGMRVVKSAVELGNAFASAGAEARAAFGNDALYLERFLSGIRHVEIQVLGDGHHVLHLGERDCSIQRRNQKLLEESPSPVLTQTVREAMGAAAVRLAERVSYTGAGTMEFIFDPGRSEFYFMEMNTRIQVEHPVTEMVTGLDLVQAQIAVAQGDGLPLTQSEVRLQGHAIECRINAEDPELDFRPSPGLVERYLPPGGPFVRVDSHLYSGYRVPPFYDSLLAKLITWGTDRREAIARMQTALQELSIDGVKTTAPFHARLLADPRFALGEVHTRFVEEAFLKAAA